MTDTRHSWIEVRQLAFLRGLRKLARLPKPPKKVRKLILHLDEGELVLSTGLTAVRVPASGVWDIAAVFPYRVLDVLIGLAKSADSEKPVLLEGIGDHFRIGSAKLPCNFQNPEINVRGVVTAERELQRVSEEDTVVVGSGRTSVLDQMRVVEQLRKLQPTSVSIPHDRLMLIAFPDLPNLLLHLTSYAVEFRIVHDPDADMTEWFERSSVWKEMSYPAIREAGLANLLPYAAQVAASRASKPNPETRA